MFHTHTVASTSVPMSDGTKRTVQNIHDLMGIESSYEDKINGLWLAATSPGDKTAAEAGLQMLRETLEQLAKQTYDILQDPIQAMFLRLLDLEAGLHEIVKIERQACALRHEREQLGPDKMSQIRKEEIGALLQRCRRNISYYKRKIESEESEHAIKQIRNQIKMYN